MADKTWSLASVTADTETDFIVPASGAGAKVLTLLANNNDASNAGSLIFTRTNSSNAGLAVLATPTLEAKQTFQLSGLIIENGQKLRVESTLTAVSFDASGDET